MPAVIFICWHLVQFLDGHKLSKLYVGICFQFYHNFMNKLLDYVNVDKQVILSGIYKFSFKA